MKGYRLADQDYDFLSDDWRKSWKTTNDDFLGSIADVQGTDAIEGLVSAAFANQAVDSVADVFVAELV